MNSVNLSPIKIHSEGKSYFPNFAVPVDKNTNQTEVCSKKEAESIKAIAFMGVSSNPLLNEARYLKGRSISILADSEEIKKAADKEKSNEHSILRYANGMYQNAVGLYNDAGKKAANKSGNIILKRGDGKQDIISAQNGQVRQIILGYDGTTSEHSFLYGKNNVTYFKNPKFEKGKLTSSDEEYLYQKGKLAKYTKGAKYDKVGYCCSDEVRLFENGQTSLISLNNKEDKTQSTSDKKYYYSQGEFFSFVDKTIDAPNYSLKSKVYNFLDGNLTSFTENDRWENIKNRSDLKLQFENYDITKAFVNNTMSHTSYFTSSKHYLYENEKPKICRLNFERTSVGTEFYADEIIF